MNIPCPYKEPCVDDEASFGNFTSESPDQLLFKSVYYKNEIWDGEWDGHKACLGIASSATSVVDAFISALNNAAICEGGNQFPNTAQTCSKTCPDGTVATYTVPEATYMAETQAQANAMAYNFACTQVSITCGETPPGPDLITIPTTPSTPVTKKPPNETQSCSFVCSSGSSFTYIVPGSYVYGANQADANARAYDLACTLAKASPACFTTLPTEYCVDEVMDEFVQLINPGPSPITWYTTGAFPPGVDVFFTDDSVILYGTPTSGGNYVFTLIAYDARGNYTTQTFSIWVMEISTPTALPDATEGEDYSQMLSVAPGSYRTPLNFQLEAGSTLPTGLMLDQFTGAITGQPTTTGDYTFTIIVQDEAS